MKTIGHLLAGAFCAVATQAMAADEVAMPESPNYGLSGYGELSYGYGWGSDNDPENWNFAPINGAIAVNYWLTPTWNLQAEAWFNYFDDLDFGDDYYTSGGAIHLGWRNSDYYIGGLGSYGSNEDAGSDAYAFAIEAQRYFENVTLYGQAGYMSDYDSSFVEAWYVHGVVRYFFDPNLMLEVNAGYTSGDFTGGGVSVDLDQYKWGAKIEWKPKPDIPVSVFAAYQGNHDNWQPVDYTLTNHTIIAGFKVMFGQDTLKDMDRHGASLADYNPGFGRFEAWDSY